MTAEINRQFSTLNVLRKLGCGWIHEVREATIRSLTFADGCEVNAVPNKARRACDEAAVS
jgi:hypothetical protein